MKLLKLLYILELCASRWHSATLSTHSITAWSRLLIQRRSLDAATTALVAGSTMTQPTAAAVCTQRQTRNALDCDQSNYSSHIVFSYVSILFGPARNSTIGSTDHKPYRETKHEVYRMTHCADIAIQNFPNQRSDGRQSAYTYNDHVMYFATLGM